MRNRLAKIGIVIALMFLSISVSDAFAQTTVYRFDNEPFDYWQCYDVNNPYFPGPAAEFGQNVCVHYLAMNSETVRHKTNKDGSKDVGWNLIQQGTALIYDTAHNLLYDGPFQVEEIAQDDNNDAECVWTDGQHAWIGICKQFFSNLDFLIYQWKITGNKVYFFKATIKEPGMWCYSDTRGSSLGPGCK
jgi:hypothetical protein